MPSFPAAGVAEILRSAQKDELYSDQLSKEISELSLEVLGPRAWLRWKAHIEATAAFAYLSTTTLCDLQTLGEEYAGLLQVIIGPEINLCTWFGEICSCCCLTSLPA